MLFFFPLDVLDEIWDVIESVSEGFLTYSCCAPRWYTKLMKPVYASLRMLRPTNSGYIDNSLIAEETYSEFEQNIKDTVSLMSDLGFIIHENKSVLILICTFLGNDIDSEDITVTLPEAKKEIIVQECKVLNGRASARIRQVARSLGLMVSSFSAVQFVHFSIDALRERRFLL